MGDVQAMFRRIARVPSLSSTAPIMPGVTRSPHLPHPSTHQLTHSLTHSAPSLSSLSSLVTSLPRSLAPSGNHSPRCCGAPSSCLVGQMPRGSQVPDGSRPGVACKMASARAAVLRSQCYTMLVTVGRRAVTSTENITLPVLLHEPFQQFDLVGAGREVQQGIEPPRRVHVIGTDAGQIAGAATGTRQRDCVRRHVL